MRESGAGVIVSDDSLASFLAEAARAPLLEPGQEAVLGRELRESLAGLERAVLGSPVFWLRLLEWEREVQDGRRSAAQLLPRGRKSSGYAAAAARRLTAACRAARAALADGPEAGRRLARRLSTLGLDPVLVRSFAREARARAARAGELRNALAGLAGRRGGAGARRELAEIERRSGGLAELADLAERVARAEDRVARARTALVEANILLVVSIAKRFSHPRMDLADLVQEGAVGLMRAAERYDERRGFRFSTYATWWVRQAIQRAIADKGAVIRLPAHLHGLPARVRRLQERWREVTGREPGVAELCRRLRVGGAQLRATMGSAAEPLALSAGSEGEEGPALEETLADAAEPSPLAVVGGSLRSDEVRAALARLPSRSAEVLRLRFGIGLPRPLTLAEAAARLGLSRERVRQVEKNALARLKAPRVAARLRDYWENGT